MQMSSIFAFFSFFNKMRSVRKRVFGGIGNGGGDLICAAIGAQADITKLLVAVFIRE